MDYRFKVADLLALLPDGKARLTEEDLVDARGLPVCRVVEAIDDSGATVQFELGPQSVGLAAHLTSYARLLALRGAHELELSSKVLEKTPTQRVLDACDSYDASLRSMSPPKVMETLLAHPDPKIGVFNGGLRDGKGAFRSYRVVGEDGSLERRRATYDGDRLYLYVPSSEPLVVDSLEHIRALNSKYAKIEIVPFGPNELSDHDKRLEARFDKPGVIWMSSRCPALPELKDDGYIVPGSRFAIEVYYHDARINAPGAVSTIEALIERGDPSSLRKAGKVLSSLRGTTNVFVNQIDTLGKVLNANLTLYAGRTQPPSLTTCIRETYRAWTMLHADDPKEIERAKTWLAWATKAAVREYESVWMAAPRFDPVSGLSRYVDETPTESPEEPPEHYEGLEWDAEAIQSDAAVREHGWDSHVGALALDGRFKGKPVQHRMLPVCLNSVLYKVECDLAELSSMTGDETAAERFETAAAKRKATMNRLMWDNERGLYSDLIYDPENPDRALDQYEKNRYGDLRSYLPMWAGLVTANSWRADRMSERIGDFERKFGLATATREAWERAMDVNEAYVNRCQWGQWDVGWPIATYETIVGLRNCGYSDKADELSYRWCFTVQQQMERQGGLQLSARGGFEGPVTEKIDVVRGSLEGSAERFGYGNQGRGVDGNGSGFRWGYDAFKLLFRSMSPELRELLQHGVEPDAVFSADSLIAPRLRRG